MFWRSYTLKNEVGKLDGTRLMCVGDMRMRTMHSIGYASTQFDMVLDLVFPPDRGLTPAEYKVTKELLAKKAKSGFVVLHSLPRMDELPIDVDATRHARYWIEAFNGVICRMALLALTLGKLEQLAAHSTRTKALLSSAGVLAHAMGIGTS